MRLLLNMSHAVTTLTISFYCDRGGITVMQNILNDVLEDTGGK